MRTADGGACTRHASFNAHEVQVYVVIVFGHLPHSQIVHIGSLAVSRHTVTLG